MPKILVIDDNAAVYETIRVLFSHKGYTVLSALSGKKGLEMFEAGKPDIVFLDIRLGDISGLEVLGRIKALKSSCRVIILTAYSSDDIRKQVLKSGAEAYIVKPFSVKTIIKLVLKTKSEG